MTYPRDPLDPTPEPRPDLAPRASGHPYDWHRWFAWRPVRLDGGRWAVGRWVERKRVYRTALVTGEFGAAYQWSWYYWAYRPAQTVPGSRRRTALPNRGPLGTA